MLYCKACICNISALLLIHTTGGLGKTTMAKLLYNHLRPAFPNSALIELDAADAKPQLQGHLISSLKQLGADNVDQQKELSLLQTRLQDLLSRKDQAVLLVVDTVWTPEQLDSLLPDQLGPGSRLIITSRAASMQQSSTWRVRPLLIANLECNCATFGVMLSTATTLHGSVHRSLGL